MGTKVSVGPPYFNAVAGPVALILMLALAIGPVMRWRRDDLRAVARRVAVPLLVAAILFVFMIFIAGGRIGILPLLGLVAAALVAIASVAPLWGRNLRRTPLFTYGMVIAHLGCAVSMAGMASESAFSVEKLIAARPGDAIETAGWTVDFVSVTPLAGPNWTAMEGRFRVARGGGAAREMHAQARFFADPPTSTTESALLTRWNGQLYLVLGDSLDDGRWQLRIWWKPFVTLIWAGGGMIGLGGALAMLGRVGRGWLRRRRSETAFA
jgi:cytochrome c-type biogenesis protein CcmF